MGAVPAKRPMGGLALVFFIEEQDTSSAIIRHPSDGRHRFDWAWSGLWHGLSRCCKKLAVRQLADSCNCLTINTAGGSVLRSFAGKLVFDNQMRQGVAVARGPAYRQAGLLHTFAADGKRMSCESARGGRRKHLF
jgi:hypothetical protein